MVVGPGFPGKGTVNRGRSGASPEAAYARLVQMPTHGPPPAAFDHVCWGYRDVGEFVTRARDFLADGVAAGERILYVASGDETALAGQLRVDARLDEAFRRGAV